MLNNDLKVGNIGIGPQFSNTFSLMKLIKEIKEKDWPGCKRNFPNLT
jgi:hypothetical protein